jgi:hypothetical protein
LELHAAAATSTGITQVLHTGRFISHDPKDSPQKITLPGRGGASASDINHKKVFPVMAGPLRVCADLLCF